METETPDKGNNKVKGSQIVPIKGEKLKLLGPQKSLAWLIYSTLVSDNPEGIGLSLLVQNRRMNSKCYNSIT